MPYIDKSIVKKLLPTIPEATKALEQAGKQEKDRNVRPLMSMLERLPIADTRLAGHIQTMTAALASWDWRIVARDPGQQQQADDVYTRLRRLISGLIRRHTNALAYGVSADEVIWTMQVHWIPRIGTEHSASDLEPMSDEEKFPGGVAIWRAVTPGGKEERTPAQPIAPSGGVRTSYILQRHGTIGGINRSLLIPEIQLRETWEEWSRFNRRLKGVPTATYKALAGPDEQQMAEDVVTNVGSSQGAVVPDTIELELAKMVDAIGATSFKEFKQAIEANVAIAWLGQANTPELPDSGGSRAAVQIQNMITLDRLFMAMIRITETIDEQVLRQDYEYNIAAQVPPELPWYMEFVLDAPEDTLRNAQIIQALKVAGFEPDEIEAARKTGFSKLIKVASGEPAF